MTQFTDIPVDDLDLDTDNPRHGAVPDQDAAFFALAREQGPKLINLALDIHENGLHPAHRLIVLSQPGQRYVVLDGNRRLAALRLIADPNLLPADDLPGDFVERVTPTGLAPSVVPCCIFESRQQARIWLERTHSGEQGGIGVSSWSASAKVRFSPGRPNQASRGIAAVDWLRARTGDDAELQLQLLEVEGKVTNLGRLVSDPYVRQRLGFNFAGSNLIPVAADSQVVINLTIVISDLASGRSVTDLKSKAQREDYIDDLIPPAEQTSDEDGIDPAPSTPTVPSAPPGPKPTPPPSPPPTPAPTSPSLQLFDNTQTEGLSHRIRLIIDEARRINATQFPNAAAILTRCTIEMVVFDYRNSFNLPDKRSLLKNIRSTIVKLEIAQDDPRYHGMRTSLDSPNSLLSADNLHQYVHNLDTHPIPSDLVQITRNYAPLIENISAALRDAQESD